MNLVASQVVTELRSLMCWRDTELSSHSDILFLAHFDSRTNPIYLHVCVSLFTIFWIFLLDISSLEILYF
jgi:hypothetical protein